MTQTDGFWKTRYLYQNLSHRTYGKDIENFVIHAIWNRVADLGIKPVAQQLIRLKSGGYRLLDLYFPQVRIAIECDEPHHQNQSEQDLERTLGIIDALRSIDEIDLAEDILHVRISDFHNKSDGDLLFDQELTRIANTIKRHATSLRASNSWKDWTENRPDPFEYFKDRDKIVLADATIDNVGFRTYSEVHQSLFKSTFRGNQTSYFDLSRYHSEYQGYEMSFGSTNLELGSGRLGWRNTLSTDGKVLYEGNTVSKPGDNAQKIEKLRVWFLRDEKPKAAPDGSGKLYRFVGVFEHVPGPEATRVWHRKSDEFNLLATNKEYRPLQEPK